MLTLLGTLLGGLFRCVPELFKWLDKKTDQKHELELFDKQLAMDRLRSEQKISEIQAQGQVAIEAGALDALRESIKSQSDMAVAAGGSMLKLSASVRPVVTYWLLSLYAAAKVVGCVAVYNSGAGWLTAISASYTESDQGLLSSVVSYWFVDRTFFKNK